MKYTTEFETASEVDSVMANRDVHPYSICIIAVMILMMLLSSGIVVAAIPYFIAEPRPMHLIKEGMTQEEVLQAVGEADWIDKRNKSEYWIYRDRDHPIDGWIFPLHVEFDKSDKVVDTFL